MKRQLLFSRKSKKNYHSLADFVMIMLKDNIGSDMRSRSESVPAVCLCVMIPLITILISEAMHYW